MIPPSPLPPQVPARTLPDRIRRGALADAASGDDAYASLDWLTGPGVAPAEAADTWADGKLVTVPAGHAWDVVRMPRTPGWEAVRHLRTMRAPIGPVLHAPGGVAVFVPVGSVTGWELPGAAVIPPGEPLAFPHPAVVAPHTRNGCSWVVSPRAERQLTDAADLYGAYAAALVSLGTEIMGIGIGIGSEVGTGTEAAHLTGAAL